MSDGIIEDEGCIAHERQVLAAHREELAQRKRELSAFSDRLNQFEAQYNEVVASLYIELDLLHYDISQLNGAAEFHETIQDEEYSEDGDIDSEDCESTVGERRPTPTQDIKDLFRHAAKSIHPDLAGNEDDRTHRTDYMAQINEAYRSGDFDQLRNVVDEFFETTPNTVDEVPDEELSRVQRLITKVKREIVQTESQIYHLQQSHLGIHLERVENAESEGWDYLFELATELRIELAAAVQEYELLSGEVYTNE